MKSLSLFYATVQKHLSRSSHSFPSSIFSVVFSADLGSFYLDSDRNTLDWVSVFLDNYTGYICTQAYTIEDTVILNTEM